MVFVSLFGADYYFAPAAAPPPAVVPAFDDTIWAWPEKGWEHAEGE